MEDISGLFKCIPCDITYISHREYLQHQRIDHEDKIISNTADITRLFACIFCNLICATFNHLKSHLSACDYFAIPYRCLDCNKLYKSKKSAIGHILKEIKQIGYGFINRLPTPKLNSNFHLSKQAFKAYLQQYELFPKQSIDDVEHFFSIYKIEIMEMLNLILIRLKSFKVQFCIQVSFSRDLYDTVIFTTAYFCSRNYIYSSQTNVDNFYQNLINHLENNVQTFEQMGSGWKIVEIDRLDLRVALYNPLSGGCLNIEIPYELRVKKCIINIKSTDNKCFLWAVLAYIANKDNKKHIDRLSVLNKYQHLVNKENLKFPVTLKNIKIFEKNNNKLNIRINIYTYEEINMFTHSLVPLQISKQKAKNTINLLFWEKHYFYIKNFNRSMGNFLKNNHQFCYNCLSGFQTKDYLNKHVKNCRHFKPTLALLPDKKELQFKDYHHMHKFPYIMYADFESLLIKENVKLSDKTKIIQKHKASSYSLVVIKNKSEIFHHSFYRGENTMNEFLDDIKITSMRISALLALYKPLIPLTAEQREFHSKETNCFLCKKPFIENDQRDANLSMKKVIDHCHLTGIYRGAAHSSCNIQYKLPYKIPLLFHNLKNYDSHFIIESVSKEYFTKCNIIPQTMEKFMAFTLDEIQVLDSFQFLASSLSSLVDNLRNSNYNFPITRQIFKNRTNNIESKTKLLFKKSFFPYEYMDSFEKFNENQLPKRKEFYSSLTLNTITNEEYQFAIQIWNEFKIKTLGEYQDFYCLLDTALLADIFQSFREKVHNVYGLEACHYFSLPGLAFSAALKYTDVTLELFQDIDMYQYIERGIRGGICGVMQRSATSINPYIENYDPSNETTYLAHYDVNNLYGYAMNMHLPTSKYEWENIKELNNIDWRNINTESDIGYILQVDLFYPEYLHDLHSDYPLAPIKSKILNTQLSKYQKNTLELLKNYGHMRNPIEKLMLTLNNKMEYTVHFKNLKLYLELGLELTKIHRGLKFKQSKFLKPYIKLNTGLRQNATSDFEKDLYKLMNNSVFGKTIQDNRKHLNCKLALTTEQCAKHVNKPIFEHFTIINEEKALIKLKKSNVKLNKPISIGFTVLELSKYHMYLLHYKSFKKYYGDNIKLIYTDTDSFIYHIKSNNYLEELKTVFESLFDFSNFNKTHDLFNELHKKQIGYLKSEYGEKQINEFIGIKSKLYSILYDENLNKKTAKGLQKQVLNKCVRHQHYKDVIERNTLFNTSMNRIQSKTHQLQTINLEKLIFTPMDDKRYILDDGVHTLPFGHYSIKDRENKNED